MTLWTSSRVPLGLRALSTFLRSVMRMTQEAGSGAGAGGGTGGAVRDAGGALGKRAVVQEEQYFRRKEQEAMEDLRVKLEKSENSVKETTLDVYLEKIGCHEKLVEEHRQQAAFHRSIIITHKGKVEYHEHQISEHQRAITKLQEKMRNLSLPGATQDA
nr:ATPase inhibitor B, mitochondrial-like [Procambarus clarkii]